MSYRGQFKIFAEHELDAVLQSKIAEITNEVNGKPDDYILNVNETEFKNFLVNKYAIENIVIKPEERTASTYEKSIPAERFPRNFNVYEGKSYPRDVIKFYLPFVGDESLLHCLPNPRILWTMDVSIEERCICFEIINFSNDPQRIKQEADSFAGNIMQQASNISKQINIFNSDLDNHVIRIFKARKEHLLAKNNLVAALGIPIRTRSNVPSTFAIPTPLIRKKINVSPPSEPVEKGYRPEPTLDKTVYREILQVIQDVGKQFERMPSTYADKDEEDLRDHILLVLEPHFEGSATGETFNKTGKTDILLRHEGKNVFIAECKYWKGEKGYLETISQLLGYLTWRDSKSAVIMFVQNKDFSSVINTIEIVTPRHINYLGFVEKKDDTWLSYRFHINNDPNREVMLAVLLFHIPLK